MIWIGLNIVLLLTLAFSFQPPDRLKKLYWIGLGVKTIGCISFGTIYILIFNTGDTLYFHKSALTLYELSETSFSDYLNELLTPHHPIYKAEWRNELFSKILSTAYVATQGNYWLSALYLALFSYLCIWFLVRSIERHYTHLLVPAFIAFVLFPSPVFWSSGILKDTLVNGSLFYLAGLCIRYYHGDRFTFSQITVATVSLLLLFYLKFYLAALTGLLMALLAWRYLVITFVETKGVKVTLTIIIIFTCVVAVSQANRNINLDRLPQSLYDNYKTIQDQSLPGETLHLDIEPTYASLIYHSPSAMIAGLFRPFIWETDSFKLLPGIENLFILLLFLVNLYYIKQLRPNLPGILAIIFICCLATALPMAAPNFGSLIRYKAVFQPFLLFLLLIRPYQFIVLKEH